jgi:hypothetical protein
LAGQIRNSGQTKKELRVTNQFEGAEIELCNCIDGVGGKGQERRKPFIILDPLEHTMEGALSRYLDIKIHHYINDEIYKEIVVVGAYDRACAITNNEKDGKMFNWQRPSAVLAGDTLVVKCPTGYDYVSHYASLIGTYLALQNRDYTCVSYVPPSEKACWSVIEDSNLKNINPSEFVVYGSGMPRIARETDWPGEGPFRATKKRVGGREITFLGCEFCVWGDIAGRLVTYLAQEKGVKQFIYIGKLGTLNPSYEPNSLLATGNTSYLDGGKVVWDDIFEGLEDEVVKRGVHFTSPSPLLETKGWLAAHCAYDYVDPEIGHMGRAAVDASIQYGYMHVMSNNLSRICQEDLSNERQPRTTNKRTILKDKIRSFLESGLPR